jgi:hypothetical protein
MELRGIDDTGAAMMFTEVKCRGVGLLFRMFPKSKFPVSALHR